MSTKTSITFKWKNILKLWLQVLFYSVGIIIFVNILGFNHTSLLQVLKALLPITQGKWWFASTYFLLYLFHPFINIVVNGLTREHYRKLLILLIVCWSAIPTFLVSSFGSNNFIWFVLLYLIAGYLRRFGISSKIQQRHYLLMSLIFLLLTYLSSIVLTLLGNKVPALAEHSNYFFGQNKINILIVSVLIFKWFEGLNIKYSFRINRLASTMFGVYLWHDSPYIRELLWGNLFKNVAFQHNYWLPLYSIFCVLMVFVFGVFIDLIRQYIFEKNLLKFLDRKNFN